MASTGSGYSSSKDLQQAGSGSILSLPFLLLPAHHSHRLLRKQVGEAPSVVRDCIAVVVARVCFDRQSIVTLLCLRKNESWSWPWQNELVLNYRNRRTRISILFRVFFDVRMRNSAWEIGLRFWLVYFWVKFGCMFWFLCCTSFFGYFTLFNSFVSLFLFFYYYMFKIILLLFAPFLLTSKIFLFS